MSDGRMDCGKRLEDLCHAIIDKDSGVTGEIYDMALKSTVDMGLLMMSISQHTADKLCGTLYCDLNLSEEQFEKMSARVTDLFVGELGYLET